MDFKLEFNMDDDAFTAYPEIEVAEILRNVGQAVLDGQVYGSAIDKNGNKVGSWSMDEV